MNIDTLDQNSDIDNENENQFSDNLQQGENQNKDSSNNNQQEQIDQQWDIENQRQENNSRNKKKKKKKSIQRQRLIHQANRNFNQIEAMSTQRNKCGPSFICYIIGLCLGIFLLLANKISLIDFIIMIVLLTFLYIVGMKLINLVRQARNYGNDGVVPLERRTVRQPYRNNVVRVGNRNQRRLNLIDIVNDGRIRQHQQNMQQITDRLQELRQIQSNRLQQIASSQDNNSNIQNNQNASGNQHLDMQNGQNLQLQQQQSQQRPNQEQLRADFLRMLLQGLQLNQRFDQVIINLTGLNGLNLSAQNQNQNNGLSQEQIENLPLHLAGKEDLEGLQQCTICLIDFIEGDKVRTLPCVHNFHAQCIDEWLNRQDHCPNCRQAI